MKKLSLPFDETILLLVQTVIPTSLRGGIPLNFQARGIPHSEDSVRNDSCQVKHEKELHACEYRIFSICRLAVCLMLVWFIAACRAKETATVLPEGYTVGPTDQCHATPQFIHTLNFERPVIDTTQEFAVGV
ncbi:MAG: hypothetical protein KF770_27990, partial [Anaerolineae bacterium]|nr:hypothetical protein [Anaerolineae bacterium]